MLEGVRGGEVEDVGIVCDTIAGGKFAVGFEHLDEFVFDLVA